MGESGQLCRWRNYRFGGFTLCPAASQLRKGRKAVRIPSQSFAVLEALLEVAGNVVTREELRARLWPDGTYVDYEHSLNAAIKRLRSALGDDAQQPRYIETLPRVGYRFRAPVESDERIRMLALQEFHLLSETDGGDAFCVGLRDAVRAELARVPGLEVFPPIAGPSLEERRVEALLEARVFRDRNRVRVCAHLQGAQSGRTLNVAEFDRELRSPLALQKRIAAELVRVIRGRLGSDPRDGGLAAG